MKNWEVLQKKISEMSQEEFIKFATKFSLPHITHILNSNKKCGVDMCCVIGCYDTCKSNYLLEEYQPPKQEKWIVHRRLRKQGVEIYIGTKNAEFTQHWLRVFEGKVPTTYEKESAHKYDFHNAVALRDELNKRRVGKQYLWVILKVEE